MSIFRGRGKLCYWFVLPPLETGSLYIAVRKQSVRELLCKPVGLPVPLRQNSIPPLMPGSLLVETDLSWLLMKLREVHQQLTVSSSPTRWDK